MEADFESLAGAWILQYDVLIGGVSDVPATGDFAAIEGSEELKPDDATRWLSAGGVALVFRDRVEFPAFGRDACSENRKRFGELDK